MTARRQRRAVIALLTSGRSAQPCAAQSAGETRRGPRSGLTSHFPHIGDANGTQLIQVSEEMAKRTRKSADIHLSTMSPQNGARIFWAA
jgi:hypothetical protein